MTDTWDWDNDENLAGILPDFDPDDGLDPEPEIPEPEILSVEYEQADDMISLAIRSVEDRRVYLNIDPIGQGKDPRDSRLKLRAGRLKRTSRIIDGDVSISILSEDQREILWGPIFLALDRGRAL